MNRRLAPFSVFVALATLVVAGRVEAGSWQWSLTPAVWRPTVELDARVEDHSGTSNRVRIDASLKDSDVAARLSLEGRTGRHGFLIDAAHWSIGVEERTSFPGGFGTVLAKATAEQTLVDLAGLYNPRGDGSGLALLYGARFLRARQAVSADFSFPFLPDLRYDFDEDLVDVLVGARFVQPFASRWNVRARANVSRGSTKMTWDGEAGFGVSFGPPTGAGRRFTLLAEYRYLELEFKGHAGSARIDGTLKNRGPLVALAAGW